MPQILHRAHPNSTAHLGAFRTCQFASADRRGRRPQPKGRQEIKAKKNRRSRERRGNLRGSIFLPQIFLPICRRPTKRSMPTDGVAIPRIRQVTKQTDREKAVVIRRIATPSVGASLNRCQARPTTNRHVFAGSKRTCASTPKKSSRDAKKKTVSSTK